MWVCPHTTGPPLSVGAILAWVPGGSYKDCLQRRGEAFEASARGSWEMLQGGQQGREAAAASQERRAALCSPCVLVGVTQVQEVPGPSARLVRHQQEDSWLASPQGRVTEWCLPG